MKTKLNLRPNKIKVGAKYKNLSDDLDDVIYLGCGTSNEFGEKPCKDKFLVIIKPSSDSTQIGFKVKTVKIAGAKFWDNFVEI